jgi:hypothetical protein
MRLRFVPACLQLIKQKIPWYRCDNPRRQVSVIVKSKSKKECEVRLHNESWCLSIELAWVLKRARGGSCTTLRTTSTRSPSRSSPTSPGPPRAEPSRTARSARHLLPRRGRAAAAGVQTRVAWLMWRHTSVPGPLHCARRMGERWQELASSHQVRPCFEGNLELCL